MQLSTEDKERIEQEANAVWTSYENDDRSIKDLLIQMAEYATIYERQKQAELAGKLQERLDRCRKVSGYSSGFSDIHNEIDFLDLLLNSLKTK